MSDALHVVLPRMPERSALQKLLCGSWKTARDLQPTGLRILERMLDNGWIEKHVECDVQYRLTYEGRRVFEMPQRF